MKRIAIIAALAMTLVASAGYAPCYYPLSSHTDYYQYHTTCSPSCRPGEIYADWWSLDGTCDTDCNGNTYCEGDTEIRYRTDRYTTFSACDPICD